MSTNIILATDSYKLTHWKQYPEDTTGIYSYLESREGAEFPYTVFFGLQSILKRYLVGPVVSWEDVSAAFELSRSHFTDQSLFNYEGWSRIMTVHGGRLPLRIRAVPEGMVVPTGNVLMTVENTDPMLPWLTNAVESLLTHVWYPSTVATLSRRTKELIGGYLDATGGDRAALPFMLHDFGYRGVSSHESAEIGGAAHLVNFVGTDTLPAMLLAMADYSADLGSLAYSVPATEHSVMTAEGEFGEPDIVGRLLAKTPSGILSLVADSYDVYDFTDNVIGTDYHDEIMARDGVVVIRPDSVDPKHPTPGDVMLALTEILWARFGGHENDKGYRVLDPHVRLLWGDGIDPDGIDQILDVLSVAGYAAENVAAFGMGGGLLQKVNRDTQRFAFKAAAIRRGHDGVWTPVHKTTYGKASKAGRLHLVRSVDGEFQTRTDASGLTDLLELVFEDGELVREQTFADVRAGATLHAPDFSRLEVTP